jgi:hypothetical protein
MSFSNTPSTAKKARCAFRHFRAGRVNNQSLNQSIISTAKPLRLSIERSQSRVSDFCSVCSRKYTMQSVRRTVRFDRRQNKKGSVCSPRFFVHYDTSKCVTETGSKIYLKFTSLNSVDILTSFHMVMFLRTGDAGGHNFVSLHVPTTRSQAEMGHAMRRLPFLLSKSPVGAQSKPLCLHL